eukprot:CAMPEP_0201514274 /NCGR_PEP_ID=MMETSP0161_2-20130828/6135_1 /ASSEMBLY_ACC=CAM_ASM_000251 /TAXON_ID=180227 /ORGANISM="Neoparamoeba aestuarina, Strain SoJaBio B1-5/56/2" /LENGTH=104 /DNA_ID=CAMNT_0047910783 /DNA_START=243 /DNA_END=554 /DNA_ORIENTATION=+
MVEEVLCEMGEELREWTDGEEEREREREREGERLGGGGWASNPRSPLLEGDIESDIGSDEEEGIVNEPEEALEMNEDLANNPNDYLDNEFDPRTHNLDNRLVEW